MQSLPSPRAELAPLGWDERREAELAALEMEGAEPARVARVDRGSALALAGGRPLRIVVTPELLVGDWVVPRGDWPPLLLERRSTLSRRASGPAAVEQPLAANVDVALVVCGLDRPLRPRRIHRALATAWECGATPVVVLTKSDLAADPFAEACAVEEMAPGVDVHFVSASEGVGLAALAAHARPARTLALLGESGSGKSTLANRLLGRSAQATGAVRAGDAKGRHTTTARHLLPLPGGGVLIDTPGIRELGLWGSGRGLSGAFADIEDLAGDCRFSDCRHIDEPGCAVRAAAEDGTLDPARLDSFDRLRRELESLELRRDERARRAQGRAFGRMAREAQRAKRRGRGLR